MMGAAELQYAHGEHEPGTFSEPRPLGLYTWGW
jgi:hypothetical protein